ncbi:MAG: hypothetical protein A2105_04775 [Omnitrophica WOR_2 bacterium GWF2_63_9]|nr:MAG: hypothetical protein A2105_04775 [Omnitrophica WOR_2 bacterium GWF2_63_9]
MKNGRFAYACAVSLVMGSAGGAWAEDCRNVTTPDFVGQVCTPITIATVQKAENWIGRWLIDEAGTFEGTVRTVNNLDDSQQVIRSGRLVTYRYDGSVFQTEWKSANGLRSSNKTFQGQERLSDGTLDGTITQYMSIAGTHGLDKKGTLRSATFDGTYTRSERTTAAGQKTVSELYSGAWFIAPDYYLKGNYSLVINPDGTVKRLDNRQRVDWGLLPLP